MMNDTLDMLIEWMLDNGVEITIRKDINGEIRYDINTMTKSQIELVTIGEKVIAKMRYDKVEEVETIEVLKSLVKDSMCGREYISCIWDDIVNS